MSQLESESRKASHSSGWCASIGSGNAVDARFARTTMKLQTLALEGAEFAKLAGNRNRKTKEERKGRERGSLGVRRRFQ